MRRAASALQLAEPVEVAGLPLDLGEHAQREHRLQRRAAALGARPGALDRSRARGVDVTAAHRQFGQPDEQERLVLARPHLGPSGRAPRRRPPRPRRGRRRSDVHHRHCCAACSPAPTARRAPGTRRARRRRAPRIASTSPSFSAMLARNIRTAARTHGCGCAPAPSSMQRSHQLARRRRTSPPPGRSSPVSGCPGDVDVVEAQRDVVEVLHALLDAARCAGRRRQPRSSRAAPAATPRSSGGRSPPGTASASAIQDADVAVVAQQHRESAQPDRDVAARRSRRRCRSGTAARRGCCRARRRAGRATAAARGWSGAARPRRISCAEVVGVRRRAVRRSSPRSASRSMPYSRIVSSMRSRVRRRPTRCSSDLSTSEAEQVGDVLGRDVARRRRRPRRSSTRARRPGRPRAARRACARLGEQLPAPLDDRAQRAVPRQRGAAAAGQQPEPVGRAGPRSRPAAACAAGRRPARSPAAGRPGAGRSR